MKYNKFRKICKKMKRKKGNKKIKIKYNLIKYNNIFFFQTIYEYNIILCVKICNLKENIYIYSWLLYGYTTPTADSVSFTGSQEKEIYIYIIRKI